MARRVQTRTSRPAQVTAPSVAKNHGTKSARRSAAPSVWPKAPVQGPLGPAPDAVAAFETAIGDLQRHRYQDAAKRFKLLLTAFPAEQALLDRVRVYLSLCEREQQRRPPAPKTIEERLTLATAALNNGDDATAERLASGVLTETPDHDLALYLLAAVCARRGETDGALARLERAMAVSPDVRAQARHDVDFDVLRSLSAFQQLLDAPHTLAGGNRRGKRPVR